MMRDPVTTTVSVITMLFVALQTTGVLQRWGIDRPQELQELITEAAVAIVGIVLFFARDNDTMKSIPGARKLTSEKGKPNLFERALRINPPKH